MPTASVFSDALYAAIGQMTEHEFDELCFQFGLELDEVTSEYQMAAKERGAEAAAGLSQRETFKIDVPANRYDLLCVEGISRALQVFRGKAPLPRYSLSQPIHTLTVKKSVCGIRDYVVAAVLRDVTFDEDSFKSFIDLQDKLHHTVCRRRQLASMGTHDLDSVKGPFTYEAWAPEDIDFVPLKETERFKAPALLKHYEEHAQLKQYVGIIKNKPRYPVVLDADKNVMSLPPIINSELSKIHVGTKNVFIEITAEDHTKANIALDTLVTAFSEYCANKFTVEPVNVVYEEDYESVTFAKAGDRLVYPQLEPRKMQVSCTSLKSQLSLDSLESAEVPELLRKMCLESKLEADGDTLTVSVPVTRSDIMHECDVVEDLGIAFGFDKLNEQAKVPAVYTQPTVQPLNKLSDIVRFELAATGYCEALTWGLVSKAENFEQMRHEVGTKDGSELRSGEFTFLASKPVCISNPKTKEFEVVRTSLLPGLLKTVAFNKANSPPICLFEVSDVVIVNGTDETGACNERRVAAVRTGLTSAFDKVHGVLDQIMLKLNAVSTAETNSTLLEKRPHQYALKPTADPMFAPGMQAAIELDGLCVGCIGVLHPTVLSNYGIVLPTTVLEFNLAPFLDIVAASAAKA